MTNWTYIARKFFLLATLLLISYCYAHAQNSPALPYINSTQLYRVPMGDDANNARWFLSNDNYNGGEALELTTQTWKTAQKADGNAEIEIKFVESVFMSGDVVIVGPWTLRYEEHDVGSGLCIAVRTLEINPTMNLFNLVVNNLDNDCNSFAGQVWDNTDDLTEDRNMAVTFSVNMEKAANHAITEYRFTASVSYSGTGFNIPGSVDDFILLAHRNGSTGRGTFDITNINTSTGTFNVRVYAITWQEEDTSDEVAFTINLTGPAINDVDVTLEISDGQAVSGSNYDVVTDENSTDDNEQTHTLWGIPNTSIVSVSSP